MPLTVSIDVPVHPATMPRTGLPVETLIALALLLVLAGTVLVKAVR